jgi:hypothetical protein
MPATRQIRLTIFAIILNNVVPRDSIIANILLYPMPALMKKDAQIRPNDVLVNINGNIIATVITNTAGPRRFLNEIISRVIKNINSPHTIAVASFTNKLIIIKYPPYPTSSRTYGCPFASL